MLNASFVKYTGFECNDVSAKLAVLSLQHPAAMAIHKRFEQLRKMYEGCGPLGYRGIPELLSWETGRFGGYKCSFIADKIHSRSIEVKDVVRRMPDGHTRNRNDCCGFQTETVSMCPLCKVCFCAACFCGGRRPRIEATGRRPGAKCGCWLAYV